MFSKLMIQIKLLNIFIVAHLSKGKATFFSVSLDGLREVKFWSVERMRSEFGVRGNEKMMELMPDL